MSAFGRYTGKAVSRILGLPPHTTDFTVRHGLRVPMRDGVELIADHYAPVTDRPAGTLLVRGPYGRRFPFSPLFAQVYAARGYHVVLQSVRGTFGSGGQFTPMVHEMADGADTVAWLRDQPWFTGSFATVGLSYLGFTQWALLADPPPEMKAAVITVGPHDFSASSWGTGAFSLNDFLGWSAMVARQEEPGVVQALSRQLRGPAELAKATAGLPMGAAARELLGNGAPWFESWLEHPERDDPFWDQLRFDEALEHVEVPILLLSGWQDLFLDQTLEQYEQLHRRGVPVALTVGPWTHTQLMTKGVATVVGESLDWLGAHLAGQGETSRSRVRIHVNGHGWVELDDWPPAMPEHELFLQPAGRLAGTAPPSDGGRSSRGSSSTFTYDPADPTPTVGGRLLAAAGGYRNDTRLARRSDVLTFTGDPLPADLYVAGNPVAELAHSCDNPHHDVFVRISEVDAKGRSRNVSDGFLRLNDHTGPVRLELDAVAHRFKAGSRIRVLIAGGSHPRFARNLGTAEPAISGSRLVPATHTVHHGEGGISRVVLPAGPVPPSDD
ncbi:CocE/NonD family hydrolase [Mycolicibacterium fortuitum]|uniref:CocE/NonD family hydrolase n=2 Tax=Mycolicibacterium fortuitum TaxID=1766 RepID=A0AAE4VCE7_MYCFO|nr:CocE/NonD family hydrolase [Mycolicibacterium fortuitum]MCV7140551.1 CocE/NonD family hydrolase [Mycolicibacterium fortuitum]MDV7191449.1 CocE/NonD family hydrolase [Mycolicibacterium fortuitum]MDV7208391.1 CocE/NonD family hydrolase [Mycolicibacterium fortuitum]MDV7225558.1 CocE/NonD family hydrolase [Mycolicibacterium fortuitum]MDV7258023.1 CocE/NonD family hydrolase [Mycolicibacterium fortuitum]